MNIERTSLKASGGAKSIGFDAENAIIVVEFNGGMIFIYHACTQEQFDDLLKADETPNQSVGAYITGRMAGHKFTKF